MPRNDVNIDENTQIPNISLEVNRNVNLATAKGMRDYLSDYFLKPGVAIPPQWSRIVGSTG